MRRREFIVGLGGTAALSLTCWSHRSSAQQRTRTLGVLSFGMPENARIQSVRPAFVQALSEAGFAEGRNIAFEFRFASGQFDRLPALAADLVRQRVDLIYAAGLPPALAAKAATATIPIVFIMGEDPVKEGVVASLGRPGGNVTGFTGFSNQLIAKRLELLHQAVPKASTIAFLVNPNNPNAAPDTADAQAAAVAHGLSLRVLAARSERDFEEAFATISQERIGALLVGVEPFFWAFLRPAIIEVLDDPLATTKLSDTLLAAQAFQHNSDSVFRRKVAPRRATDVLDHLCRRLFLRHRFLSHLRSSRGLR